MTIFQDFLAGTATEEDVKAEVRRLTTGARPVTVEAVGLPDLSDDRYHEKNIIPEIQVAEMIGKITPEQAWGFRAVMNERDKNTALAVLARYR